MPVSIGIRVDRKSFDQVNRKLRQLGPTVRTSVERIMRDVAVELKQEIQRRYLALPPDLSEWTIRKRQQGKSGGITGAIQPVQGIQPLRRTGVLVSSIVVRTRKTGKSVTVRARIREGIPEPNSILTVSQVAQINEVGLNQTVTLTPPARAYLKALEQGIAGTDIKVWVSGETRQVTINIPARPVWGPLRREYGPKIAQTLQKRLPQHLRRAGYTLKARRA